MGWHYRPPANFPAVFANVLREAAATPDTPILLHSSANAKDVETIAERFRWFRWCIRQEPTSNVEFYHILEAFDIRTSTEKDAAGIVLYVTAKPTKISEVVRLNQELASELLPKCQ